MWKVERTKVTARAVEDSRSGGRTQADIRLDIVMRASGEVFNLWRILAETRKAGTRLRRIELNSEGQLHCETGPAVVVEGFDPTKFTDYEVKPKWYYLQGFEVPAIFIEDPDNITMKDIQDIENAEVRRIVVEHIGSDRFVKVLDLEEIDRKQMDNGQIVKLLRTRESDTMARSKIQFVQVECTSTGRQYHICVPLFDDDRVPIEDAHTAVAWTFEMDKETYRPTVET